MHLALDTRGNKNRDLVLALLFVAMVFYILRGSEQTTVLAMLLMVTTFGLYIYLYPPKRAAHEGIGDRQKAVLDLKDAVSKRDEAAPVRSYMIKSFPKTGLKYLRENEDMMSLAQNLLYLQVYDKGRYQDMLLLMDRLHKVYIYTLVGRYSCQRGLNLFMDLRELLREKLYSFYIVVPMKTKHMYGLDPHGELDRSISQFTAMTRRMITVIENYARRECKVPYLDPTTPLALDPSASPNTMP
jgi:hypothetical protein